MLLISSSAGWPTQVSTKLNADQQNLICVWAACGEVDNGGIWQFFYNTSGDWSSDTVVALETIGAPELAEIIRSAMAAFPDQKPHIELDERRDQIDAMSESDLAAWDSLSARFDTTSMEPKIAAYIRDKRIYAITNRKSDCVRVSVPAPIDR